VFEDREVELQSFQFHSFRDWCCHLVKNYLWAYWPPSPSKQSASGHYSVPSAFASFKCILEVLFCEGVQQRLRFCLDHLSCASMAAFQFYLQSGEKEKQGG
jgi:hypothetical protein